ncbi:hypothetical protein GOBAR_AA13843 [Gossypium barbadense]|uniref:Uncharacterized protein n=1 Tax=Gossypium barbadense TaxID=3634 RepID=A0A2P5XTW6_GOSBA|nr:hypothetical protein GOBAR_AA13843 [Gossypium barbadense]
MKQWEMGGEKMGTEKGEGGRPANERHGTQRSGSPAAISTPPDQYTSRHTMRTRGAAAPPSAYFLLSPLALRSRPLPKVTCSLSKNTSNGSHTWPTPTTLRKDVAPPRILSSSRD